MALQVNNLPVPSHGANLRKLAPSLYGWTGLLTRARARARVGCQLALGVRNPYRNG